MKSAAKPLCGANWPTPCEDCVGSCGIEEYEAESVAWARWEGFGHIWISWGFDGRRRWFSAFGVTVTL